MIAKLKQAKAIIAVTGFGCITPTTTTTTTRSENCRIASWFDIWLSLIFILHAKCTSCQSGKPTEWIFSNADGYVMLSEYFRYLRLWFSGARRVRAQWGLSPYFFLQLFCYSQPVAEQQSNSPDSWELMNWGNWESQCMVIKSSMDMVSEGEGGRGKCKYYSLISMPIFVQKI